MIKESRGMVGFIIGLVIGLFVGFAVGVLGISIVSMNKLNEE